MSKFSVVLPHEVQEFDKFIWSLKSGEVIRLLSRLVGINFVDGKVSAVYRPTISLQSTEDQTFVEFHFTRYVSVVFMYDDFGPAARWVDLRKL
ncbi:MAG: hypothetical protein K0B14_20135 [Anaerolineaceae bacterium]|nr:hypothetical protein [Anaerolineaceae bacterium]